MGKTKKPSGAPVTRAPHTSASLLRKWAAEAIRKRGFLISIRLVRVRNNRLEEFTDRVPSDLGLVGLFAGAHLLGREALPNDLIAVLGTTCYGRPAKLGEAIFLCARSKAGERIDDMWLFTGHNRLPMVQGIIRSEILDSEFLAPTFLLDSGTLEALAARGFPGAVQSSEQPVCSTPPPSAFILKPTDPQLSPRAGAPAVEVEIPWGSVDRYRDALSRSNPFEQLPWLRLYVRGVVAPPGLESLPLTKLIRNYGSNAAFSPAFHTRLRDRRTFDEVAAELLGNEIIDLEVRAYLAVSVIDQAIRLGKRTDLAKYGAIAEDLCRCLSGGPAGELPYLDSLASALVRSDALRKPDSRWIAESARAGCAMVAIAAMAVWRIDAATEAAVKSYSPEEMPAELPVFQHAQDLCVGLASIAAPSSVRPNAPTSRTLRGALDVLVGATKAATVRGRQKVLSDLLGEEVPERLAHEQLRRTAMFHAYQLHSRLTYFRLILAHKRRLPGRKPMAYAEHDLDELFDVNRTSIARSMVLDAALFASGSEVLPLLSRARQLAPSDEAVTACANEGSFRCGVRSLELLEQLRVEGDDLGALAEGFVIADGLGDPRRASFLRRLVAKATSSPLGFGARVLACFERPGEFAHLESVRARLSELDSAPTLDSTNRYVHALFGPEPAATINRWRERLQRQQDVLAAAEALAMERVEDALTRPPPARRERPSVPDHWHDNAAVEGVAAIRHRLSRPAAAALPCRFVLHQLARDALALAELDEATLSNPQLTASLDSWLVSLRGDLQTPGLVPALELYIATGDATAIDISTAQALNALQRVRDNAWVDHVHRRLALLDAGVLSVMDAERLNQVRARALANPTESERGEIDSDIAALEGDRARTRVEVPHDLTAADNDSLDSFRQMIVPTEALARSRAYLDTPEWAIDAGMRQVALYNASRGRRDLKMLASTRDQGSALWELRHRDARHPVRVLWRTSPDGPVVIGIMVKDDESDQRRVIERVLTWGRLSSP
ncbi:MAG: hypothetical protein IV100_12060 [Myxococcales bacterium]|nr:hypothetical protein [Myxococcales bacterium]